MMEKKEITGSETEYKEQADDEIVEEEISNILFHLKKYGISHSDAVRMFDAYGDEAVTAVLKNPYLLIEVLPKINFLSADKIAEKMGIAADFHGRIKGAIKYKLYTKLNEGHVFCPAEELYDDLRVLLDLSREDIEEQLTELAFDGQIRLEKLDGSEVVYLIGYYLAEQSVCASLVKLNSADLEKIPGDEDLLIERAANALNFAISEDQKTAVAASINGAVTVITGGPGTGKTAIITLIMKIFEENDIDVEICAPTGRAAKRITETSGYQAKTIHRLLEYYYSESEDKMRFGKNSENKLDADAVIIDEASMIDIMLMKELLEAVKEGTRVIIAGDSDQLPSVGAGNVLQDIIESELIESIALTEIFRQSEESMIIVNAHKINKGELPDCNDQESDFFLLKRSTEREISETIVDLCKRRLPNHFEDINVMSDVQVITPTHRGSIGTAAMNRVLQEALNPADGFSEEKKFKERLFREGDKVMQIKNNYQLSWIKEDDGTIGYGVFNGDLGNIATIDNSYGKITVRYDDDRLVSYDNESIEEIELAYAITVHKSQGSEFPIIIMPISWFPPMLATRNLLYTAVTRAKNTVILVGSENRLNIMINNDQTRKRNSGLSVRLKQYLMGI